MAGSLDLKVDSEAHYAGLVCIHEQGDGSFWDLEDQNTPTTRPDLLDKECNGTWSETDLGPSNKFFDLADIKPGDSGEDTISLHVVDNDAWGRLVIDNVKNLENVCNGPELLVGDTTCGSGDDQGELQQYLQFNIWLDQGALSGFQCSTPVRQARCDADPTEGDNIQQQGEPTLVTAGTLDPGGETLNIWQGLAAAYAGLQCAGSGQISDQATTCPGLSQDGHMIGSITYYFGLGWELPGSVGNIVQTDGMLADMTFEAQQYRNNPSPFPSQ